jgi:hypothetical protein
MGSARGGALDREKKFPVSSAPRGRAFDASSPPHPNPLPQGEREFGKALGHLFNSLPIGAWNA